MFGLIMDSPTTDLLHILNDDCVAAVPPIGVPCFALLRKADETALIPPFYRGCAGLAAAPLTSIR